MRLTRLACLLLSTFAASIAVHAQQVPQRDAQAVATLNAALAAMGGAAAVGAIQDATVQGTIQDQSSAPPPARNFVWMTAGSEFRNQMRSNSSTRIFVSGHGAPVDLRDGKSISLPYHMARATLPYHLPAVVLLSELSNPNYTISFVGLATVSGKPAIKIHTGDESDRTGHLVTPQNWYFDASSGLPLRVEYQLPRSDDAQSSRPLAMDFSDFRAVNGVLIPFRLAMNEGAIKAVATVSSVVFNSGLSSTEFDAPSGGL